MGNFLRAGYRTVREKVSSLGSRASAGTAAAAVVAGAAGLRLLFVDYGLPNLYFWDEATIVNVAREMVIHGRLWPDYYYNYPSAVVDLQVLTSLASYVRALATEPEFLRFEEVPVHHFYLFGRLAMVACAVATVVFVYRFAADIWRKPWWGVAAAAVLALSHHHIAESRQIGVDVPLAALVMAGLYFLFRFGRTLRGRDLLVSAVLWGAAASTKYNAVLFAFPVFVTLLAWRQPVRRFLVFAAAAAGAFLVLTPGAIFRMNAFVESVAFEYYHYKVEGHYFLTSDQPVTVLARHLWDTTFTAAPALLLLVGVAVFAVSRRREAWLFLLFPLTFVVALTAFRVAQARFIIDLLPMLALLFGVGFGSAAELLRRRGPAAIRAVLTGALVAGAFYGPASHAYRGLEAWAQPDQRTLAAAWIHANVPWPAVIVKEVTHVLPLEAGGETDAPPVDETKYKVVKVDWITRRPVQRWARVGAVYYLTHVCPEEYAERAAYTPGALRGTAGDNAAYWRRFELVTSFIPRPAAPFSDPICIYRLKDSVLAARHPYRRTLPLERGLAKKAATPHDDLYCDRTVVRMYCDCCLGYYFTAPASDYKIGFRCDPRLANGVGPRVRVRVDGEPVADIHANCAGLHWTPRIPAGPNRYHHLALEYYNDTEDLAGGDRGLFLRGLFVEPEGAAPPPR